MKSPVWINKVREQLNGTADPIVPVDSKTAVAAAWDLKQRCLRWLPMR